MREFRGLWIANVFNLDWPSRTGLSANLQKRELLKILNLAYKLKMNAVIFQVRSSCDTLYASKYEPWSPFLSGKMGKSPGYDPLAFAISEAHKRGMELHAWFNPFRALASSKLKASSNHISKRKSWLIAKSKGSVWLNPAYEQSRHQALLVIVDVLSRYDVDGIHIDDYFYPYPKSVKSWSINDFPDEQAYKNYRISGGNFNKSRWRRENINKFVRLFFQTVKHKKPYVRVGISPFGIWQPNHPRGIEADLDALKHIHADSRLWLQSGWCDYFSPQLYWRIFPLKQSFSALLQWWNKQNHLAKNIWPGIAVSRINSRVDPGRPAWEIINQIKISRKISKAGNWGHILFSANALLKNKDRIVNLLTEQVYQQFALPPARNVPANYHSNKLLPPKISYFFKSNNEIGISIISSPHAWQNVIQVKRINGAWYTEKIFLAKPERVQKILLKNNSKNRILAIAICSSDRFAHISAHESIIQR